MTATVASRCWRLTDGRTPPWLSSERTLADQLVDHPDHRLKVAAHERLIRLRPTLHQVRGRGHLGHRVEYPGPLRSELGERVREPGPALAVRTSSRCRRRRCPDRCFAPANSRSRPTRRGGRVDVIGDARPRSYCPFPP